ncbi:MAG: response regulator [Acidobacteria bacterium]|nr:response regulator [Acidobacteriota bacterium]
MAESSPNRPRILFVTYLDTVMEPMIMILNREGFEGYLVPTAEEMLEKALEIKPDVVVSEILLYPMNGVDGAIRLQKILPSAKFLMFSGGAPAADVLNKAREQGHEFEVVGLPFHPQDLMNRLCRLVGRTPVDLKVARYEEKTEAEASSSRSPWDLLRNPFRKHR